MELAGEIAKLDELLGFGFIQEIEYQRRLDELKEQFSNEQPKNSTKSNQPTQPKGAPKPTSPSPVLQPITPNIQNFPQPTSRDFSRIVSSSTAVICPPKSLWKPIVDLKRNHMNPRIKRNPYPHITLLAPFVQYHRLEDAKRILHEKLQHIQPFRVDLNRLEIFYNSTSFTLYIVPETNPPNILQTVYDICAENFPQCTKNGFDPHIGIGYFKNKREAEACLRRYQASWSPMSFTVQEIYFNTRTSQESDFEIRTVVPLGGLNPPPAITPTPE
jgi:2'-5' RNA ligase